VNFEWSELFCARLETKTTMIEATRVGITYSPKTLVVEYKKNGCKEKRFHKIITFREVCHDALWTKNLIDSYPFLKSIPFNMLNNLIHKLDRDGVTGDFNKLSDKDLRREKEEMDKGFIQNSLKRGDSAYQYDKRMEHEAESDSSWD